MSVFISRTAPVVALVFSFGCSTSDAGLFSRAGRATAPVDGIGTRDGGDSGKVGSSASSGGSAALNDGAGGSPYETQESGGAATATATGGTAENGAPVTSLHDAATADATYGGTWTRESRTAARAGNGRGGGTGLGVAQCTPAVWYPDNDGDHYPRTLYLLSVSACSTRTCRR